MKILVINGSPRANGATGQILGFIGETLRNVDETAEVDYVELGKLRMQPCSGCLACYKTGGCYILEDGLEELSHRLDACDGVVFGSPTYASNVSGQFKILVDRGHFVFEQLLRNKACFSVATYENYGGGSTQKVIQDLIHLSGGAVSGRYLKKLNRGTKALDEKERRKLQAKCARFLKKAREENPLTLAERIRLHLVFHIGLKPHAEKNAIRYAAILKRWVDKGLVKA